MKQLPLHTVKAQLLSEERYVGTVTRELNSGQWRSEACLPIIMPMKTIAISMPAGTHTGCDYLWLSWHDRGPCMQDSNNGLITYAEAGPGIKPGTEASVEFRAADTRHMRAQLRKGTAVEFNLCTDNHTQQRRAVHVSKSHPAIAPKPHVLSL